MPLKIVIYFLRKLLIYIGLCIFSEEIDAQINLKDNDLYCNQYSRIIEFISEDSCAKVEFPFSKLSFQINNKIGYGMGGPIVNKYFIAQTLGKEINKIDSNDSTIVNFWKNIEKEEYENRKLHETSTCLADLQDNKFHYNVFLNFARKSERVVFVNSKRIYDQPRHTNGIFYLFFFDSDNKILKAYRESWIE